MPGGGRGGGHGGWDIEVAGKRGKGEGQLDARGGEMGCGF